MSQRDKMRGNVLELFTLVFCLLWIHCNSQRPSVRPGRPTHVPENCTVVDNRSYDIYMDSSSENINSTESRISCTQLFDSSATFQEITNRNVGGVGRGYTCSISALTSCPNTRVILGPNITCVGSRYFQTEVNIPTKDPQCNETGCESKLILEATTANRSFEHELDTDLNTFLNLEEFVSLQIRYKLCGSEKMRFILGIKSTAPLAVTCSYSSSSEASLPPYGCPGNEATTTGSSSIEGTTVSTGGTQSDATLHARNTWPLPVSKKNTIIIACVVVATVVIFSIIATTLVCRRRARYRNSHKDNNPGQTAVHTAQSESYEQLHFTEPKRAYIPAIYDTIAAPNHSESSIHPHIDMTNEGYYYSEILVNIGDQSAAV